jgi:predicted RNA-binding Zn-ribbon protein involved in translation (DUF1610 family)
MTQAKEYLKNIHEPPVEVVHSAMQRCSDESDFKSVCPKCPDGMLLVMRDQKSFQIINVDRCIVCGQQFIYMDSTIAGSTVQKVTATPQTKS